MLKRKLELNTVLISFKIVRVLRGFVNELIIKNLDLGIIKRTQIQGLSQTQAQTLKILGPGT